MAKINIRNIALLFLLSVPAIAEAQWRPVTGQTDIDALRFDTPEQAQTYLRGHYSTTESSEYQYLVDWINPELSYPDGRYSFRICFTPVTATSSSFNPVTCSAGTTSGHLHTDFIVPVDMDKTTLLDKNTGMVCRVPGQDDSTVVGNPINTSTGNKFEAETDHVGGGQEPLEFTRFYNSKLALSSNAEAWRHTYSGFVDANPFKYGTSTVVLQRPDGKRLAFYRTKDGWFPTWKTDDKLTEVNGVFAPVTATLNGFTYTTAPTTFTNDGWIYTRSDAVVENYDHNGVLTSINYPSGNKLTLTYNEGGLASVTNSYGRTLVFVSDNGRIQSMSDPDGSQTTYQYNNGLLQSVTRPDGHVRQYLYEDGRSAALLTGIIDERGVRYATWTYDNNLNANSSEHAGGAERTEVIYNQDGSVTTTNALGHNQSLLFSSHNGLSQPDKVNSDAATGVVAGTTTYTFNSQGFLSGKTNAEGQSFGYAYNSRGLETQRTSDDGGTISTIWHGSYAVPLKITDPTLVTDYTYDDHLHVTSIKQTERSGTGSRTWAYVWGSDPGMPGRLLSIDGPRTDISDLTTFTYDNQENITEITNALGHVTRYQNYDANGRPGKVITPNGIEKTLTYDYRGDLVSLTDQHGTISLTRDEQGRLIGSTLQDGSTTSYEYDDAGRLTAIVSANGDRREYSLDAANNITEIRIFDAAGGLHWKELRTYNELSYLTTLTDSKGNVTSYAWDRVANLLSETDPAGHTTQNGYDGFNHQTKETNAAGGISTYRYDGNGRLTYVADARSKSTSYTRNGFGDVITQASPDTGTTTFTYDNAGNIITRINSLGQKTTFAYDALNRLTGISSSVADTASITLSYDGSAAGTGHLTGITDDAGTTAFNYTDQGLLSSVIRSVGGRVYSTSYTYDDVGRRLSLGYPSGRLLHYLRDDHGEITGLSLDVQNGQSVTIASNITFKPEGPLRHLTFGNGLSEDRTYNLNYQPESIYVGNVLNRSYEYSPDGNIINARDNLNPAYGHAASYDAIDRMVQSTGWYGVYSFTYDANGNRTSVTRAGTKDTYSISTSNNYLTKTSVSASSYTYDATGNITKRGSDTFTYNGYGQLVSATVNGIPAQYKYNLSGLRVSKTVSGQTTLYFYDNDGRLLSEVDAGTGAVNREYIWLGTKPVAYLSGEQVYYIHTDNTETPQLLTNSQGNVVWTIQTYPFGKQSFAGSVTFNLRYPGQYFDEETGLHYNWHRYYDPNTGRYITSDPIGLAGGLNTYAYVGNDPIGSIDPDGLMAIPYPFIPPVVPGSNGQNPSRPDYPGIQGLPAYPGMSIPDSLGDTNESPIPSEATPWSTTRPMRDLGREWLNQNACDSTQKAKDLGYGKRIPPQKAPFNSHGQPVFTNGKNYISPDVDGHSQDDGWKMFDRWGDRTGTWNSDLSERIKD